MFADIVASKQHNQIVNVMQNRKQKGRGGKRKGAGRKPKYSEPTTTIAFRVPESKIKDVKDVVKKML